MAWMKEYGLDEILRIECKIRTVRRGKCSHILSDRGSRNWARRHFGVLIRVDQMRYPKHCVYIWLFSEAGVRNQEALFFDVEAT